MAVEITVRDGREEREVDSDGKGVVLAKFERDRPLDEGDILALADGTRVTVIGYEEKIGADSYTQTVYVGSILA